MVYAQLLTRGTRVSLTGYYISPVLGTTLQLTLNSCLTSFHREPIYEFLSRPTKINKPEKKTKSGIFSKKQEQKKKSKKLFVMQILWECLRSDSRQPCGYIHTLLLYWLKNKPLGLIENIEDLKFCFTILDLAPSNPPLLL